MSDTPRTDEYAKRHALRRDADRLGIELVLARFARTLERELTEAHARITFLESHEEAVSAARIAQGDTIADLRSKLAEREAVLAGIYRYATEHDCGEDGCSRITQLVDTIPASTKADAEVLAAAKRQYSLHNQPSSVRKHTATKMCGCDLCQAIRSKQSAGDKP